MLPRPLIALLGIPMALQGCAPQPSPRRWIPLDDANPVVLLGGADLSIEGCEAEEAELGGVQGFLLRWTIPRDRWSSAADREDSRPGVLRCERPSLEGVSGTRGTTKTLEFEGGAFEYRPIEFPKNVTPGSFGTIDDELFLELADTSSLPARMSYTEFVPKGEKRDGSWHVAVDELSGTGLPIWAGETWRVSTSIPEDSTLRFFLAARGSPDGEATPGELVARVRLDGRELWSHARAPGRAANRWHELPLPAAGVTEGTLELSVEGTCTPTAFLDVTIGPRDPARLSDHRRPNIVLFLSDTFRADNMAAYGGDPEVTPFLNALAEESVLFERAWSTSSWTLPAHASIFSSLHPPQHGAELTSLVLPRAVTSLTEVLEQNGYRTGAVTDGNFVSRNFNMNQGFRWFREIKGPDGWDLGETLRSARAFLDSGDGRPSFLFVHTYRVHEPYRVGEDESREEAHRYLVEAYRKARGGAEVDRDRIAAGLIDIYRQGVTALDLELGRWMEGLRELHGWERTTFFFTSDHGEGFYEHRRVGHKGPLWEEVFRIPLLIHAADLEPARRTTAASLIDLAPTIAGRARVPIPGAWQGIDLLSSDRERAIYGFYKDEKRFDLGIVDGDRKVLSRAEVEALRRNEIHHAYDLGRDPAEQVDLAGDEGWPLRLAPEHAERLAELLRAHIPAETLSPGSLDAENLRVLRELGYLGDE